MKRALDAMTKPCRYEVGLIGDKGFLVRKDYRTAKGSSVERMAFSTDEALMFAEYVIRTVRGAIEAQEFIAKAWKSKP